MDLAAQLWWSSGTASSFRGGGQVRGLQYTLEMKLVRSCPRKRSGADGTSLGRGLRLMWMAMGCTVCTSSPMARENVYKYRACHREMVVSMLFTSSLPDLQSCSRNPVSQTRLLTLAILSTSLTPFTKKTQCVLSPSSSRPWQLPPPS